MSLGAFTKSVALLVQVYLQIAQVFLLAFSLSFFTYISWIDGVLNEKQFENNLIFVFCST